MEGRQKGMRPVLKRGCEANRLEEQIWALAYEQVFPLIRRERSQPRPTVQAEVHESSPSSVSTARRA
jgi:hypothetical protein